MSVVSSDTFEPGLTDRFDTLVREHAERPAIVWDEGAWSYAELNRRALRLARRIVATGCPEEPTLLLVGHGADEIAAMFACLKAGSAYVALDPATPPAQLAAIARDVGATRIICGEPQCAAASGLGREIIVIEGRDAVPDDIAAPPLAVTPETLAAIVYTSGSTGEAKGVMRSHRCVLHRSRLFGDSQQVGSVDRIAHMFSCSFAAAEVDVYGALLNGATLCIYPTKEWGIAPLADWLLRERITLLHPPPTLFRRFLDGLDQPLSGSSLRCVSLAGEAVHGNDLERIRRFLPGCTLQHRLSASETSVITRAIFAPDSPFEDGVLPVGQPVADKDVRLIDRDGNPVAPGEIGEIEVRSRYLADGYWRRPELTRDRFRSHEDDATRSVRTGDLASWRSDGMLQHHGRVDRQVKVRGYRVEPEAIECALLARTSIAEAAVVARRDERGETHLVAWVAPRKPATEDARELRRWLAVRLPAYAIPARIEFLDALPVTATGKVDRVALGSREFEAYVAPLARSAPDARDGLEYQLRLLWQDVMDRRGIEIDDDFFDLGGNSIQLADLMLKVERLFGAAPALAAFVAEPTIAAMAAQLRGKRPMASSRYLVPLRTGGSAPPFFCVHPMSGSVMHFIHLARYFDDERPFYGLQARGIDGCGSPHTRIEAMATDYLVEVRRLQPEGPYYLGGRCFGGVVAAEMARQLIDAGERVAIVAVFDTRAPRALRWKKYARRRWKHLRKRLRGDPDAKFTAPYNSFEARLKRTRMRYRPERFPGSVTLFTGEEKRARNAKSWKNFAQGGVEVETIPGEHFTIFREPHVRTLVRQLEGRLVQASHRVGQCASTQ